MRLAKEYRDTKFDSKTILAADEAFKSLGSGDTTYWTLKVDLPTGTWNFDTVEEFLAVADQGTTSFRIEKNKNPRRRLTVYDGLSAFPPQASVEVEAPTRGEIESIIAVFDNNAERCRLPAKPVEKKETRIFIGHGHNPQWRDLKDHLHEKHGYAVEAYEIGSRAGHTIRDILEDMLNESSCALLIMTGEDETKEGGLRARQNVIHETGLFQGRLGFSRAIVLLEEGTEEFSNIHGIQQIRFSKGKIIETFGEVLAVLKREFGQ